MYLAAIGPDDIRRVGDRSRNQARIHAFFENGTESRMLRTSLNKALYGDEHAREVIFDGRWDPQDLGTLLVRELSEDAPHFSPTSESEFPSPSSSRETHGGHARGQDQENASTASSEETDEAEDASISGHIYVLRSLSTDPQIRAYPELHKIGYTTGSVTRRISRAQYEPTYLMAPVEIVAQYGTVDMNTQKLEKLLHDFFAAGRLSITQINAFGHGVDAREWFDVPLSAIHETIERISDGSITRYVYSARERRLVLLSQHRP